MNLQIQSAEQLFDAVINTFKLRTSDNRVNFYRDFFDDLAQDILLKIPDAIFQGSTLYSHWHRRIKSYKKSGVSEIDFGERQIKALMEYSGMNLPEFYKANNASHIDVLNVNGIQGKKNIRPIGQSNILPSWSNTRELELGISALLDEMKEMSEFQQLFSRRSYDFLRYFPNCFIKDESKAPNRQFQSREALDLLRILKNWILKRIDPDDYNEIKLPALTITADCELGLQLQNFINNQNAQGLLSKITIIILVDKRDHAYSSDEKFHERLKNLKKSGCIVVDNEKCGNERICELTANQILERTNNPNGLWMQDDTVFPSSEKFLENDLFRSLLFSKSELVFISNKTGKTYEKLKKYAELIGDSSDLSTIVGIQGNICSYFQSGNRESLNFIKNNIHPDDLELAQGILRLLETRYEALQSTATSSFALAGFIHFARNLFEFSPNSELINKKYLVLNYGKLNTKKILFEMNSKLSKNSEYWKRREYELKD